MRPLHLYLLLFSLLLSACSKDQDESYHLPSYVVNFENHFPGDTICYEYSDNRLVKSKRGRYMNRYGYDSEGRMVTITYIHEGADERPYIQNTYRKNKLVGSAMLRYDGISGEAFELISIEYQYYGDTLITKYYHDPYQGVTYLEEWQTDALGNLLTISRFYYPSFGSELG